MDTGEGQDSVSRGFSFSGAISPSSIAAHELKSPLALIRQLSCELETAGLSDDEKRLIVEQIRLISERALRLTSNLTKVEQLQTSLFPTSSLHPAAVCEDVFREIQPLYVARNRRLTTRSRTRSQLVVANQDMLRRVLLNFIDNALHYGDEQGVVELSTKLLRKQETIRFGVRDYGPELPVSIWKDIVRRPMSPQVVHARPESSGLGLAIAHQFAETIGGKIGAIRHRDGASFYVDLPISKQLSLL